MFTEFILKPIIESAEKYEKSNAFCINEKYYTYGDLFESVSKVCFSLKNENLANGVIGIVANDDLETYASIIAVWMEGYAYVPLHPKQPITRNIEIISLADVSIVLDSSKINLFESVTTIRTSTLQFEKREFQPKTISDDSLAYILFTSGSTGKPKGVMITRGNLGAFMKSFWDAGIVIDQNDRCLQCFDLTFDVSIQSFLVPLTRGACTYTIPHDQIKYSYVYGLLEDHKITFGAMAPSMIRYLRPYFDEINIPSMRYSIMTAEASPIELIGEWSKCIPNAEIYNFYGPTEATIYCTFYKYDQDTKNKEHNGIISLGKPMRGLVAIITDNGGKVLDKKQTGELCISGEQITPGYWRNDEKNFGSFIELKWNGTIRKYYKTGDACYFDEDQDIMLVGRLDQQVKIQGFRVELGEIEYHARRFLDGKNACAIAFENNSGNNEIALFVEDELTDQKELVESLKLKLPHYMVPTKLITMTLLPLNANGKTDRNELKKTIKP